MKERKNNPDKIGFVKFWGWQTRGVAASVNFIMLGYISLFCTDALGMSAALIGTLLMASKVVDAITDLLAGYIVDKTNTRWGKGRPYEWFIVIEWVLTYLLFATPAGASNTFKAVWILVMYVMINAVCTTFLSAAQNPYMIRAFGTDNQRVKLASFGGIVIMVASMAANIILPTFIEGIRTDVNGWRLVILCVAVPMAVIGIFRFFLVKETIKIEDASTTESVTIKDTLQVLKGNKYVWFIGLMYLGYSFVTGMGIHTYYFTWVIGDLGLMGTASAMTIVVLPLLFVFPIIMKKISKGTMVRISCVFYIISGLLLFYFGEIFPLLLLAFVLAGIGSLPITYLVDLMMLDAGTYNHYTMGKRMDGTIGAIKGFLGKLGGALGIGAVGWLLELGGYNGLAETQTSGALFMIKFLAGYMNVIVFAAVGIVMLFYNLDKLLPEIEKKQA